MNFWLWHRRAHAPLHGLCLRSTFSWASFSLFSVCRHEPFYEYVTELARRGYKHGINEMPRAFSGPRPGKSPDACLLHCSPHAVRDLLLGLIGSWSRFSLRVNHRTHAAHRPCTVVTHPYR